MYYLDEINFVECETYEEAEESVMTTFDDDELFEVMSERLLDILDELRRLNSPLFWELYETAKDRYLDKYITEIEEDEEPCCEDCGHKTGDGIPPNSHCFWCNEYSEFQRKNW